ncbi:acyl-CoA thioesterase [Thalassomonas actiniarum]|uniref:Acyl-CoA thioesterase n=1 Tax=Thalassomonas actiniarum TaxID=485447 RepID=A0AAE9YKU4_9GAMM|nr:thioesterase family protein [Thalassomonas actiniarum]WDD97051.1 acyl-CoA thioesterase [Thalassomonas actiniarum]
MPNAITIKRKVRFGDCDPGGIVYTPRFADFAIEAVDSALAVLFERKGGISALMNFGIMPPARSLSFEFLHPVTWDDELSIKVSVDEIRLHAFCFLIEGYLADNTLAFSARLTQVCVSPETKKTVKIPEMLKVRLAQLHG